MDISRTKNVSRGIFWGILEKLITIALPFIMRTIMIYTLGDLYLGLNGLFTSVLQVLNVAELGISSAIVFSMYGPLASNNIKEVNALLNFYKRCYRVIGVIVMVLGMMVLPFLRNLISGEIPPDINIYVLYLMNLANVVLSYELYTYRTSLLIATQRIDVVSKVRMSVLIFQYFLQFIVLLIYHNYYLFISLLILSTCINNIISAFICKKIYPQYKCEGNISKQLFQEIKKKVSGMFFQKVGGIVLSSVDTLVISSFLGLRTLAIYQNYYYIITAIFGVLAIIMQSLISSIGNSIVLESKQKNYKDFRTFNFIYIWIVSFCTICLLCIYQPFMTIWVGKNLMLSFDMVILFAIYFFTHKWCDMLYVYQDACGLWWETKLIPFIAAIVNLIINILLVNTIGLAGILISTIISVVFIYDIGYAYALFREYFKESGNLKIFIVRQLAYLLTTIMGASLTYWVCDLFVLSSLFKIVINLMICIIVPNIIFVIVWRRSDEFSASLQLILRILPKSITKRLG